MAKNISQTSLILEYMRTHEYITDAVAADKFGAHRLSGIIFELRKKYDIETVMVEGKHSITGQRTCYGRYILKGDLKNE